MIKLQSILESVLSEVGENTATPYDFKVKREWEDEETWYEWKTDEEGEDPISYTMTVTKWSDYTGRGDDREFNYEVEFGIDLEGGGTSYHATSKTMRTGNMRRVMATVIAALKQEIAKDNKKPGVHVSTVYMSPSKEEETDERRAKLYLSYIEKNKPAGSTVTYSDRGSIEIKLPKPGRKETEKINEAFYTPHPTRTVKTTDYEKLYHATYKPLLKKIKENGLNTMHSKKAWEDSIAGYVYLATDKDVAASYAESSDYVPESWLDQIIVLTIDVSKIDASKLFNDQNVRSEEFSDTLEYRGVIPWSAVIQVEDYE